MRKAFSLIEVVVVLVIVGILISMARNFFSLPARYILESEQCINAIHGEFVKTLFQATTGKSKIVNSGDVQYVVQPNIYSIYVDYASGQYMSFGFLSGTENTMLSTYMITLSGNHGLEGCNSSTHQIQITGSLIGGSGLRIDIAKNLLPSAQQASMTLCKADSGANCLPNTNVVTGTISYNICKKDSSGIVSGSCTLFFVQLIDTRTQNIFNKKCLSLPFDKPCSTRSTNDF